MRRLIKVYSGPGYPIDPRQENHRWNSLKGWCSLPPGEIFNYEWLRSRTPIESEQIFRLEMARARESDPGNPTDGEEERMFRFIPQGPIIDDSPSSNDRYIAYLRNIYRATESPKIKDMIRENARRQGIGLD